MERLLVAAALFFISSFAMAADSGFYLGAGLTANSSMTATCQSGFCTRFNENAKDSGHGRLIFGYDFNRFIGVEGGYSNYGTYQVRDMYQLPVGTVKVQGVSLAARGGYKFQFGLSLFGKLGLSSMSTQYTAVPGWTFSKDTNQTSTGLLVGLGLQYDFNEHFAARMISEAVTFNDNLYHGAVGGLSLIGIARF